MTRRATATLSALVIGLVAPVGGVHAAECGTSGNIYWTATGTAAITECAADANAVYWVLGTAITRRNRDTGAQVWSRDLASQLMRPVPVVTRDGVARVIVAAENGFVYALDASNGQVQWSRSTRRVGCSADRITSTPCVQLWKASNATFQSAINTDLVLVGTRFGCSTTTANQIHAINANDGSVRWIMNNTASYQQDAFAGLALDYARNLVYGTMDSPSSAQNTLVAVSTTSGARRWSRDLGAVLSRPLFRGDSMYVMNEAGVLHKLDLIANGIPVWSEQVLSGGAQVVGELACQEDSTSSRVYVTDTSGLLTYVEDQGDSAAVTGTTNLGGRLARSGPLVIPSLGHLYVGTQGAPGLARLGLCSPASFSVPIDALSGVATRVVEDLFATGTARLLIATDAGRLSRYCIPWPPGLASCMAIPPIVTVVTPAGGEVAPLGASVSIEWTTSAPGNLSVIDVLVSRAGIAGPFVPIASGVPNTGFLSWTVTGPATESALFQVVAYGTHNTIADAANSGTFAIRSLSNTIDACVLESPSLLSAVTGTATAPVFSSVYKSGLTTGTGAPPGISAEMGYGPDGSDPSSGGWTWVPAAYSAQQDSSDVFVASFLAPAPGVYDFAARFTFLGGPVQYGDLDGSGNGYSTASAGHFFVGATVDAPAAGPQVNRLRIEAILPNPSSTESAVHYVLPRAGHARLSIHDVQGRLVAVLDDRFHEAGAHTATWRGMGGTVAPGVYWARLESGGASTTRSFARR